MSHDTPNIVADNHAAQFMNASPEDMARLYVEGVLLTLRKRNSLRKGKTTLFPINPS